MPFIGWKTRDGSVVSPDEALEIARETGAFEGWIEEALLQMVPQERPITQISPSGAGYCQRQEFLKQEVDYTLEPDAQWPAGVGTAIHLWIASAPSGEEVIKEKRFELTLQVGDTTLVVSGQPDVINVTRKRMTDAKSVQNFYEKDYPQESHVLQQNIYRYLLKQHGIDVDELFLWYVRVVPTKKTTGEFKGFKIVEKALIPVPLMDEGAVVTLLQELAEMRQRYIEFGELPPAYEPSHPKYWQCGFCPVAHACAERAMEEAFGE